MHNSSSNLFKNHRSCLNTIERPSHNASCFFIGKDIENVALRVASVGLHLEEDKGEVRANNYQQAKSSIALILL
jgi:hypothetical protein